MNPQLDSAARRPPLPALLAGLLLLAACGDDPINPDPDCLDSAPLVFGVTFDSILWPGDPVFDGSSINYFAVTPATAGSLSIEMAAEIPADENDDQETLDPFLYLWADDDGDPIAQGIDPTGEGPLLRTASLTAEVTPGCYRVGASGWPGHARGGYTIRADLVP